MIFIKERIGKLLSYLEELVYPMSVFAGAYRMKKTEEKFQDIEGLDTAAWEWLEENQSWGGHREYYWFETTVVIPEEFDGRCVVYELRTGREGNWDATNPQFTIYVNGKLRQGLDVNHREVVLSEAAEAGECYRIVLSAFTGDQNFSLKLDSRLRVLDRRTEQYYYDCLAPYETAKLLEPVDPAYITIITHLNQSLNLLDLRKEYSESYYESLKKASEYLEKEFYGKECGSSEATVYTVGHTHLDVAWLWTLAVTEDKAVRSFSTVLALMDRYPEYTFMSSQPQLYQYVKKNAPQVYEKIKERVAEGRWEVEGGMFLEPDCNIASGESLVRQCLYGTRFFQQEFGKDNVILWLPDVFGYSAALPQIMLKCGLSYFMTTKLSWNELNRMPYDTFWWEGIDGSRVLTHFVSSRDYKAPADEGGYKNAYYTTYNAMLEPVQVKGCWDRYEPKYLNKEVLMTYGYGDGGGGPTAAMLENQRRTARGIPGCPRTKNCLAREFFEVLDSHVRDNKYLPSWVGELYLEYHRGTYTSMARNKRYNRKAEFAFSNLELYSVLGQRLAGEPYPASQLHSGWEVILRNQFHDILPGSSIREVYEDSKAEYEEIFSMSQELTDGMLSRIANCIRADRGSVVVFNPGSTWSNETVAFADGENRRVLAVYDGEKKLPLQYREDGSFLFLAKDVPPKGYKVFALREEESDQDPVMLASPEHMENGYFILEFNEKGQFSRIYDKLARREVLKPGQAGNVLVTYEDRPHNYDAWDVNNYYTEKSWEMDQVERIAVTENGPVRACVRIERKYLDSTVVQNICLYRDIPRIDITNEIDWKEHQIFVRALFPVDVHANEAAFDIQYGNVKRATHYNTSWDFAKFEVCAHKWLDLSEDGYGVSLLNDCKYGCSVHDGVIGLSLLKSAVAPNPDADKERHRFTYSLYPHSGDWKEANTVAQAYRLNNPSQAVIKETQGGFLKDAYSFVTCNRDNVIVEVVKKAEDSEEIVVRLYECYNRRTSAELVFGEALAAVSECSMLEKELSVGQMAPDSEPVLLSDGRTVRLSMKPYEIKTLKLSL